MKPKTRVTRIPRSAGRRSGPVVDRDGSVLVVVSVKLLILEGGKVLLVRRRKDGRWTLPGGHLLPGESTVEAGLRETDEETTATVRIVRTSSLPAPYEVTHVLDVGKIRITYVAELLAGADVATMRAAIQRRRSGEVDDLGLFHPARLPASLTTSARRGLRDAFNAGGSKLEPRSCTLFRTTKSERQRPSGPHAS